MNTGLEKLSIRSSLFGDRAFYHRVYIVVLPMIVQNTLSSVLSLLDNIMVGQVGTIPMSAVAIISQFFFIFYLTLFGAQAGAGIYGAQFFGCGDYQGMRSTLRAKFIIGFAVTLIFALIFLFAGDSLASSFIAAGTSDADRTATLSFAHSYLFIMVIGMFPFLVTSCYSSTLREAGRTALPMKAGITGMVTNFVFNSLLIFGLLGFPKLGVAGAAIATVISRFVEMSIVVIFSHRNKKDYPFLAGLYERLTIPRALFLQILTKSAPLLANEFLWSLGQAFMLQCYSGRGLAVIAALNICYTVADICHQIYISVGSATQILVGQNLGADRLTEARYTAWRMSVLTVLCCILTGIILAIFSPLIPQVYNTENEIRQMATSFLYITAVCMPFFGFETTAYFTLRSGGKTFITFLFDSFYTWVIPIPAAFLLTHFTALPILPIYMIVSSNEIIKCILGFFMVKKGRWVRNLVTADRSS